MFTDDGEIDFLTGVNVGAAIPGRLPSELQIDAATWRRWLPMIADLGVHAVRIYTVQPPHFYEEFRAYNEANPDRPLYLVHGVWLPEELLAERRDLFDPEVMELDPRRHRRCRRCASMGTASSQSVRATPPAPSPPTFLRGWCRGRSESRWIPDSCPSPTRRTSDEPMRAPS